MVVVIRLFILLGAVIAGICSLQAKRRGMISLAPPSIEDLRSSRA